MDREDKMIWNYDFKTGLKKTLKNWLVIFGPALVAGLFAFRDQIPPSYWYWSGSVAFVAYFVKNMYENYPKAKRFN